MENAACNEHRVDFLGMNAIHGAATPVDAPALEEDYLIDFTSTPVLF